jgi:hypothetical protein
VSHLFDLHASPDLDSPVLVVVLEGWIDAGYAAASALTTIKASTELATIATFDTDTLLDHRARRPTTHLEDGVNTGLTWPTIELSVATDRSGHDVLLLTGAEPDHSWRAFAKASVDLALEFGARLVTGLGAYPAPVPHTRATRVVSTATTPELAKQVGFMPGASTSPVASRRHRARAPTSCRPSDCGHRSPLRLHALPGASLALIEALDRIADIQRRGRPRRRGGPDPVASTSSCPTAPSTSTSCASSRPSRRPRVGDMAEMTGDGWPPSSSASCATRAPEPQLAVPCLDHPVTAAVDEMPRPCRKDASCC